MYTVHCMIYLLHHIQMGSNFTKSKVPKAHTKSVREWNICFGYQIGNVHIVEKIGKIYQVRNYIECFVERSVCCTVWKTTGAGAWSKRSYCHVDSFTYKQHTQPQKSGRTWAWCCQVLVTFDPLAEGLEPVPARQLSTGSRANTKFEHAHKCLYRGVDMLSNQKHWIKLHE